MATIQVILHGIPGGSVHDTDSYPIILHFEEGMNFEEAVWVIPSYPGHIPGDLLSEIRVIQGPLNVVVDGPEGFQSGPHDASWVRGGYPRGKLCAFLNVNSATRRTSGVTVEIVEGSIVVGELVPPTGAPPAAAAST